MATTTTSSEQRAELLLGGFKVANALDLYIESLRDDREMDGKYHPSSMFQCTRKVVYNVRGVPASEPLDLKSQRRFYIGHRLHEVVQAAIDVTPGVEAFYPEFEADVPALNIAGHGDGLILLSNGNWLLLELKSIRKTGFRYGLREENLKQAKAYAAAVRIYGVKALSPSTGLMEQLPPLGDKLVGILVVYVEKEDLDIREHFIEWEDSFHDFVVDRVNELNMYIEAEGSLPPRIPKDKNGNKNWQCRFCPYQRKCWNEDPAEIPIDDDLPF